jgi:hypothetical protein
MRTRELLSSVVRRVLASLVLVVAGGALAISLLPGVASASAATVSLSTTAATAAEGTYTVGFAATGGLSSNSVITLTTPTGTVLPAEGCNNYTIYDAVSTQSDGCLTVTVSSGGNVATITSGIAAGSGDAMTLTVNGVTNASSTGTKSFSVTTSSGASASGTYSLTAATAVTKPTVTLSSKSVTASDVTYAVGFTATNGMTENYSQITLAAPSGVQFPAQGCGFYTVFDAVSTQSNGCLTVAVSGSRNTATVTMGISSVAGDKMTLTVNGVTNDSTAGTQTLSVSTTSDPVAVTASFKMMAVTKVTALTVGPASPSVNATEVAYNIGFTATSGMTNGYSQITVGAPSGVLLPSQGCGMYTISDATNTLSNGCLTVSLSASHSTATITMGITTQAADKLTLAINGVANGPTTGARTFSVSTTSDPSSATKSVTFVNETKVTAAKFTSTSSASGATEVSYTVTFKATHAMTANFSGITLTAPAGTVFPPDDGCGTYTDLNDTTNFGWSCPEADPSGDTVVVSPDVPVRAGDTFTIVANGVTNPTAGSDHVTVSTSSDPATVSLPFKVTASTGVQAAAFASSSYSADATEVTYSTSFTATSGLTAGFSQITLSAPSGTVFPVQGCNFYTVADTTDGLNSNCLTAAVSGAGNSVTITTGNDVRAGDRVTVVANGVTNPTSAGSDSVTVSTTSDSVGVTVPFAVTSPTSVTSPTLSSTTPSAGVRDYTVGFTSTNGLTANFSEITLAAPSGTVFPNQGCNVYTVTDSTDGQNSNCLTATVSGGGNSVTITIGNAVRPGDVLSVVADGVTGPARSSLTLSTTSDPAAVSA